MNVKLIHAALDIFRTAPDQPETLILRGVLDPQTIEALNVDTYQREVLGGDKMTELKKAHKASCVPDIELGMRGDRIRCVNEKGGEYILLDPVYIIDGLQRVSAAKALQVEDPGASFRIGCTVHFDTNFDWERNRFRILNLARTKVSVNVLLRNSQSDYRSIEMIGKLCQDETFALHSRVQWQQNRLRQEVVSAMTVCRVAHILHSRFGAGEGSRASYQTIATDLDKIMEKVGRTTMRANIHGFFELVDSCFGVRKIVFSNGAVQVKETFLCVLAEVFSTFDDFWTDNKFAPERRLRLKIAKFPIQDPEVARLASSGGQAREVLYELFLKHINRGKRSRRLMDSAEEPDTVSAGH